MSKTILIKKDMSQSARITRHSKRMVNELYLQAISKPSSLKREMTRKGCISYES